MNQTIMILYTTIGTIEEAEKLAEIALSHKLAACVNILSNGQSIYLWEGKIEKNNECYLIFKTDANHIDNLETLLLKHHPYKVPAILKWECKTSDDFYDYVKNSLE